MESMKVELANEQSGRADISSNWAGHRGPLAWTDSHSLAENVRQRQAVLVPTIRRPKRRNCDQKALNRMGALLVPVTFMRSATSSSFNFPDSLKEGSVPQRCEIFPRSVTFVIVTSFLLWAVTFVVASFCRRLIVIFKLSLS